MFNCSSAYPETLDVEIIICSHNRAHLLMRTLQSINACINNSEIRTGIFVAANACADGTHELLDDYIDSIEQGEGLIPLRWHQVETPGKSHALNVTIPLANGNILAFVDDDHRVDEHYIRAIYDAAYSYPEATLFCGKILPDWDGSEPSWVHAKDGYRIYPLPVPQFDLGPHPVTISPGLAVPGGGNLAIRKGVFEKNGPFMIELGPHGHNLGGAEDIEWVRRAMTNAVVLKYVPDMIQFHVVEAKRLTLTYVMRKAYERSASTTRLSEKIKHRYIPPPYMIRKIITYTFRASFSIYNNRRRFYLTRLAASVGELKGFFLRHKTSESKRQIPFN